MTIDEKLWFDPFSSVEVFRLYPYITSGGYISGADYEYVSEQEKEYGKIYPESRLVLSGLAFPIERNCHDFAWGPWMSPANFPAYSYREAWWMNDPRTNWFDNSFVLASTAFKVYKTSLAHSYTGFTSDGSVGTCFEYLFDPTVINALPQYYCDSNVDPCFLPVSDIDAGLNVPKHPALLGYVGSGPNKHYNAGGVVYNTPANSQSFQSGCRCEFVSKWGIYGIYRHRAYPEVS